MADKHSVETVKKLLEAAKPRAFKESVEVAVNLRDVDLSVQKNRIDEETLNFYTYDNVRWLSLSPARMFNEQNYWN